MTIFLLLLVLMLLGVIVFMMVTGWPGRHKAEIEKAISSLRRELAEQRVESLRFMQSIRTGIEDTVEETLEREMADLARRGRFPHVSFNPRQEVKPDSLKASGEPEGAEQGSTSEGTEKKSEKQMSLFEIQAKQALKSFPKPVVTDEGQEEPEQELPEASEPKPEPDPEAEPRKKKEEGKYERVKAAFYDDIPDISDIADLDEMD